MQLVRVYETVDPVRGLLVRGLLESDGLDVLAKDEGSGPYRMGPVTLFVPDDAVARARELIAASEAGALTIPAEDDLGSDVAAGTPTD